MTATATLTERYIAATVRSLRPEAQADVRAELEASIDDAIEARVEHGEPRDAAERAVLTGLGDPGRLAAGYADRPLHLIGPRFYLVWWRLLKLLLIIVPACVFGAVALGQTIAQAPIGKIIADSLVAAGGTAIHLCFWTTLVFVVLERTDSTSTIGEWSVDQLPEIPENPSGRTELIGSLVFLGLCAALVVWDAVRGFIPGTEALPILAPSLWPWGIAGLFAIMVLEASVAVAVYVRGRWTTAIAILNSAIAAVFAGTAILLLLRGALVNPAFVWTAFTANGVPADAIQVLAVLLGVVIAGTAVWDIIDGWLKTARARRA